MQTRPVGSIVGAIAGVVFVLVNAGANRASLAWRVVAVVVLAAIIWFVVVRGAKVDQVPRDRAALRTYCISQPPCCGDSRRGDDHHQVFDRPNPVLVWVVFVVGAHFVPRRTRLPVVDR